MMKATFMMTLERAALVIAVEALNRLKRGECWCEMAIGNPTVREHSKGCDLARAAIETAGRVGVPPAALKNVRF
jgi:hypothetical protein